MVSGVTDYEQFVENGYNYACQQFDVERNVDALIKLFKSKT